MQIDKTGLAGGFRVAVGNGDHAALLECQNIVNIFMAKKGINEREFGGAGVAKIYSTPSLSSTSRRISAPDRIFKSDMDVNDLIIMTPHSALFNSC
jgi:hypothetical protein